jgi:ComF family protein
MMLDLIFPNVCSRCDTPAAGEDPICGSCLSEVKFISDFSSCGGCGTPFGFFSGEDNVTDVAACSRSEPGHLCGRCLRGSFSFDAARSVVLYEGKIRDMIHEFKYEGRLGHEGFLSSLLIDNFPFRPGSFDLVVPVPMHISKLRKREYNQSALLAHNLARWSGTECDLLTFKKTRDTRPQIEFRNEEERRRNVMGAFSVTSPESFKGKSVLLVDDVFTTGSTSDECAREMLKSGAQSVSVFTLSRAKGL